MIRLVDEKRRFPYSALVVLAVGLIAVVAIMVFSSPVLHATTAIDSIEQAKALADQYVAGVSSDLNVAEVMEFSNHFYVMVQESDTGINALELLVDKGTGRLFSEPGPNMMWNTKYGMMGGFRGAPTADMPINAQKASEYAQKWLDVNIPGAKAEEPETFYGYYTMDVSKSGSTYGMLSVHGYTGDVWYHTWHGTFIKMVEYN